LPSRLPAHQLFDLLRFNGNVGHQIDRSLFGQQDIIFQPNSEALFRDVNARLDSQDPARRKRFMQEADIMHIESERVPQAVHEIFLQSGFVGILLTYIARFEQPEPEQFLLDHGLGLLLPVPVEFAGHGRRVNRPLTGMVRVRSAL
jgi:hypothetical protein